MNSIYSFLQKRKMHENQHGMLMVVIAYILSAFMLMLGSDLFYDISTAASDNKAETNEETKQAVTMELEELHNLSEQEITTQTSLWNPYDLQEFDAFEPKAVTNDSGSDTVWLLGNAMDCDEYNALLTQMGGMITEENAVTETKQEKEETIQSFSINTSSGDTILLTENEVSMLERIVQAEAGGEDMTGKILIVNVIMNRLIDEAFPDTVEEVIFQKSGNDYQFSPVKSGRYWSVKISKQTREAVQRAMEGKDYSKGALYFVARKRTTSASVKWFDDNLDKLFKHGGHEFYR